MKVLCLHEIYLVSGAVAGSFSSAIGTAIGGRLELWEVL